MKKYSIENLIKVDSYIEEYFKVGEDFSREYLINEIPIEKLKNIIAERDGDEELYLSYEITENASKLINENLKIPIVFDFEKFEYFLQRYGEYK
jgi:hypothetical protein